ncbi:hypothetical protein HDV00_005508 [Rhizophlyctis rosea]|nr:hypothetical protein HDV00_005508 [Rhizophlyctis rosea]
MVRLSPSTLRALLLCAIIAGFAAIIGLDIARNNGATAFGVISIVRPLVALTYCPTTPPSPATPKTGTPVPTATLPSCEPSTYTPVTCAHTNKGVVGGGVKKDEQVGAREGVQAAQGWSKVFMDPLRLMEYIHTTLSKFSHYVFNPSPPPIHPIALSVVRCFIAFGVVKLVLILTRHGWRLFLCVGKKAWSVFKNTLSMNRGETGDVNANADLNDELLWRFLAENFWPGTRRVEWKVVHGLYLSIKTSGEEAKVIVTERTGR